MGGLFHFEERKNIFIPSKKSNFLEMMKPEQKSRVDLEQISLGCHGPWWTDPRVYRCKGGAQELYEERSVKEAA